MSKKLYAFKAPVVCGVLLLLATVLLMFIEHEEMEKEQLLRAKAFAEGFHESCQLLVNQLAQNHLTIKELRPVLRILVSSTRPLKAMKLFGADGEAVASEGIDVDVVPQGENGQIFVDQICYNWSPISVNATSESYILLTALGFRPPKHVSKGFYHHPFIKYSLLGLIIVIAMFLWGLTIYTRELALKLKHETAAKERLRELGLSAAGLAHETKNPLGIILGLAQRLSEADDVSESTKSAACQIMDNAENAASRLGEFIEFARLREPELKTVPISSLTEKAFSALSLDFEDARVELNIKVDEAYIVCDEEMVLQVLLNLLLNSLHATGKGGSVTVEFLASKNIGTLCVSDTGCGIAPEILSEVFSPYVSGNTQGHGLGLAIVKRVVDSHGWEVLLSSVPDRGTTVSIQGIQVKEDAGEVHEP